MSEMTGATSAPEASASAEASASTEAPASTEALASTPETNEVVTNPSGEPDGTAGAASPHGDGVLSPSAAEMDRVPDGTQGEDATAVAVATEAGAAAPDGGAVPEAETGAGVVSLADPATALKTVLGAELPPEAYWDALGIPDDKRREGYVYYDEREGHLKAKDLSAFIRTREANDEFVSGYRTKEQGLVAEATALREQLEAKTAEATRVSAILKAAYNIAPEAEDQTYPYIDLMMPDKFKGVDPDDLLDSREVAEYWREHARAEDKVREHFETAVREAEGQAQEAAAFAEAGAAYVEASLTKEAMGIGSADYDLEASLGKILASPVEVRFGVAKGQKVALADALREVGALFPEVADLVRDGMKMRMHAHAGVRMPFRSTPSGASPSGAVPAQTQQQAAGAPAPTSGSAAAAAGNRTAASTGSTGTPPATASTAPAAADASRQMPVHEATVTTTATPPVAPSGGPPKVTKDGLQTIADALERARQR